MVPAMIMVAILCFAATRFHCIQCDYELVLDR